VNRAPHMGRRHRGSEPAVLGEQACWKDQTRGQETERDLKKAGSPTPHILILDLRQDCRPGRSNPRAVQIGE
jgi:hypothetical protein